MRVAGLPASLGKLVTAQGKGGAGDLRYLPRLVLGKGSGEEGGTEESGSFQLCELQFCLMKVTALDNSKICVGGHYSGFVSESGILSLQSW